MAKYVDGFVIVLPKKNLDAYRAMARAAGKVWRKYGALDYKECVGEDLTPDTQGMPMRTFPKLAKTKPGETVVFSYIVYKSRKHRDAVNKKVMKDPIMNDPKWTEMPMPFDMKKMSFGGFDVIVEA